MTARITVKSEARPYEVVIGPGAMAVLGDALRKARVADEARVVVITDETVEKLGFAAEAASAIRRAGWHAAVVAVPPGDASKSLQQAERLYNALLDEKVQRNGVVVAVGGGAVGDLAGFVAATYLRGIRWVQVPTTLLAHDSSIGGKVGINLPRGKNLVGAFHPPLAVLYDTRTLRTLPPREWSGGMAEVIKHAIIGDPELFRELETDPVQAPPKDESRLEALLARAIKVKVRIVEADERESGLRMWLNLGHTIGHAVELLSGYAMNHGEAVSVGLAVESELAVMRGWLEPKEASRIRSVLSRHLLPVTPPPYPWEDVARVLAVDKKHRGTRWTFVLPRAIGRVETAADVDPDEVMRTWQTCTSREDR